MSGESHDAASSDYPALINTCSTWTNLDLNLFRNINWSHFMDTARLHGVHAIAAQRVLKSDVPLKTSERELLRSEVQSTAIKAFPFAQEVLRITSAFREQGLRVVPYKGPVLSEQLWKSFSVRECADLDFLVPEEEADRAASLLRDLGYEELSPIAEHLRPALHKNASEEQFVLREKKILLELQWSPAPHVLGIDFGGTDMWRRVREIDFTGDRMLSFAPDDLFSLLAIHAWKHNFSRLIWLGDLAQLIRLNNLDFDHIFDFGRRTRTLGIIQVAVDLVRQVYGVSPRALECDPSLVRLAESHADRLRSKAEYSYADWHRFMLAARNNKGDQFRQISRFLLTPGLGEYKWVSLPAWAQAGYRLLRIARVLGLAGSKSRE